MARDESNRVCPVQIAGRFNSRIRRWIQNPGRILRSYVSEGMTVLDLGCGPGFFTLEMARMVGPSGRVIGCDLQEGMLQLLEGQIRGTAFQEVVTLHQCEKNHIGLSVEVDFILLFYVFHEIPSQEDCFREMGTLLRPDGQVLIVEPPFHVSKAAFEDTVGKARDAGFVVVGRPRVPFSKTVVLKRG